MSEGPFRHDEDGSDLPAEAVAEATRLTRLDRTATDPQAREAARERRDSVLGRYGYTARVREADATLVCYPAEWVTDGTVRFERIEDTGRAVEVDLTDAGPADDWDAVDATNRALASRVREECGPVHGATADAFADYMSNHHARPITDATAADVEEFTTEYFPRNAWPSERQKAVLSRSLEHVLVLAESPPEDSPITDRK